MAGQQVKSNISLVNDEEKLYRRIRVPREKFGDFEEINGIIRVTEAAFQSHKSVPFELSVDRADLCKGGAEESRNRLDKPEGKGNGVAVLLTKEVRGISKTNVADHLIDVKPKPTENHAHAAIYGKPAFTSDDFDLLKAELCKLANSRSLAIRPILATKEVEG